MDAKRVLADYKKKLDKRLADFFDQELIRSARIDKTSRELVELLKDFTLRGGKRLRAALLYYGYLCFEKENPAIIDASMSMELIQSFLLIHDDIIDKDDTRRGGPAMHTAYKDYVKKKGIKTDASHLGISLGICAGDMCSAFGNKILANMNVKPEYRIRALEKLGKVIRRVVYGQTMDILANIMEDVSAKDVMKMEELKTATYTVEGPLCIGALLAGAKEKDLNLLSDYAIPIGVAYQIQDDILGLYGREDVLGKPVGSDIKQGKKTPLIIIALDRADKKQEKIIQRNLGKQDLTQKDLEDVRKVVRDTGALDYCRKNAGDMINTAKKVIAKADFRKQGKDFLIGIADYMLERKL